MPLGQVLETTFEAMCVQILEAHTINDMSYPIWMSYQTRGNLSNKAIERVIDNYGVDFVVTSCVKSVTTPNTETIFSHYVMLPFAQASQETWIPFANQGLHTAIVQKYWNWVKAQRRTAADMYKMANATVTLLTV